MLRRPSLSWFSDVSLDKQGRSMLEVGTDTRLAAVQGGDQAQLVVWLHLIVDSPTQFPIRVVDQHQDLPVWFTCH
jgi:hypothetical protein